MEDTPHRDVTTRVETRLVHAHGVAALVTLLVAVLFGIVASIQLLYPDLGASQPFLTWGRLRYSHTQGIMLGWLGNAFFAFLYHAVPLLSRSCRHEPAARSVAVWPLELRGDGPRVGPAARRV